MYTYVYIYKLSNYELQKEQTKIIRQLKWIDIETDRQEGGERMGCGGF